MVSEQFKSFPTPSCWPSRTSRPADSFTNLESFFLSHDPLRRGLLDVYRHLEDARPVSVVSAFFNSARLNIARDPQNRALMMGIDQWTALPRDVLSRLVEYYDELPFTGQTGFRRSEDTVTRNLMLRLPVALEEWAGEVVFRQTSDAKVTIRATNSGPFLAIRYEVTPDNIHNFPGNEGFAQISVGHTHADLHWQHVNLITPQQQQQNLQSLRGLLALTTAAQAASCPPDLRDTLLNNFLTTASLLQGTRTY